MNKAWDLSSLQLAQSKSLIGQSPTLKVWGAGQLQKFLEQGFPKRKNENWKYASLQPFLEKDFLNTSSNLNDHLNFDAYSIDKSDRIVFINGLFSKEFSKIENLPKEVILTTTTQALKTHPSFFQNEFDAEKNDSFAFSCLNGALMDEGLFLLIPAHIKLAKPIHLLYLSTHSQTMRHPRHIIAMETGTECTILEEYSGLNQNYYWNNVVTEIWVGANAHLQYYKLQRENAKALHVANTLIDQQENSVVQTYHIAMGGEFSRDDIQISLRKPGSSCDLIGFYYPKAKQYIDYHTKISHYQSHTNSLQYYKGILNGAGHGVFNGKIIAHAGAQEVTANQSNHNLLLSSDAEIDTKPELEVYADNIKCNHGATVGNLDLNALFYLQSRGIEESVARHLLVCGFANEIFDRMPQPVIAEYLRNHVMQQLANTHCLGECQHAPT